MRSDGLNSLLPGKNSSNPINIAETLSIAIAKGMTEQDIENAFERSEKLYEKSQESNRLKAVNDRYRAIVSKYEEAQRKIKIISVVVLLVISSFPFAFSYAINGQKNSFGEVIDLSMYYSFFCAIAAIFLFIKFWVRPFSDVVKLKKDLENELIMCEDEKKISIETTFLAQVLNHEV